MFRILNQKVGSISMSEEIKWEDLEQRVANLMQKKKVPGFSLAVIKDQEIIYSKGFGNRDVAKNLPATTDTLYGIASCTKVFTCIAIMQLAEQGKISIDDPVNKYLPFKIGLKDNPIKIKHLMSHSSGLPNLGAASVLISRHAPWEETWVPFASKDDFFTFLNGAQEEVVDEPGKRYFYFNAGFTLLGEIIEKISGLKFENYVIEFILKPLQMNRSTFLEEVFSKDDDRMVAYTVEENKPVEKKHPFDQFVHAAGGLLSSVNELTNFLKMLLNNGVYNNIQIIKAESLEKMFKIQIEYLLHFFGRSGYGYGLAISEDFLGYKIISHGGSTGLSSAHFAFIPELKIGVVSAGNVGDSNGVLISQTVLSMLLNKIPEEAIPFYKIEEKMEQFSGEYSNYKNLTKVKVIIENGILLVETISGEATNKYPLIPEDLKLKGDKFYIYTFGGKTPVTFEIKESNKIDMFIERNCFHKIK
jgi:CubicO group peptidase (beta-lactamase class C family)